MFVVCARLVYLQFSQHETLANRARQQQETAIETSPQRGERLALEKERATAPNKLEPAARRLGLKPARPGQIAVLGMQDRLTQSRQDAEKDAKKAAP